MDEVELMMHKLERGLSKPHKNESISALKKRKAFLKQHRMAAVMNESG